MFSGQKVADKQRPLVLNQRSGLILSGEALETVNKVMRRENTTLDGAVKILGELYEQHVKPADDGIAPTGGQSSCSI